MDPDEIRRRIDTGHRRQPPQAAAAASSTGVTHGAHTGLAAASTTAWWPGYGTQPTQCTFGTYPQQMMGSQPATAGLLAGTQDSNQIPAGSQGYQGPPWIPGYGTFSANASPQGFSSVSINPVS